MSDKSQSQRVVSYVVMILIGIALGMLIGIVIDKAENRPTKQQYEKLEKKCQKAHGLRQTVREETQRVVESCHHQLLERFWEAIDLKCGCAGGTLKPVSVPCLVARYKLRMGFRSKEEYKEWSNLADLACPK